MTQDMIQAFSMRVTQANQSELTVISYEIFLCHLQEAIDAIVVGNEEGMDLNIKKCSLFLTEMMAALNFENPISFQLYKIYSFAYKTITKGRYSKKVNDLQDIYKIMNQLLESFREVAKEDESPAVMENTQQIYAGLTYGKGYLNETCMDEGSQMRGFKA